MGRGKPIIVIEHLEPVLTKWLYLEYKHVSSMVGRENLVITNVKEYKDRLKLSSLGRVYRESISLLIDKIEHDKAIVLEPKAREKLEPQDFNGEKVLVIIGGIMGDHPPKGRTWDLLTSKLLGKALPRSLGPGQLSIDGAAYVALKVASGVRLEDIPLTSNVEVEVPSPYPGLKNTIILPFTYPVVDGKPLLTPGLVEYLRGEIVLDEDDLLRRLRVE